MLSLILAAVKVTDHVHHTAAAATTTTDPNSANVLIGIMVCFAVLTAIVAAKKKRNPLGWGVAGFFFFFIPLIVLGCQPDGNAQRMVTSEQERELGLKVAQIQSGSLTPFVPTGVMPAQGEQFFWEQRAQYGQTHTQRVTQGASPAMYVPLGHGVRMRVGGWKGASQTVTNFAWGPIGTVFISNMRVIFKADNGEVAQAPFHEILTYDAYPDGLGLNVNKIGIMQFKTGDACLGAVFLKMVQAPPKEEQAVLTT